MLFNLNFPNYNFGHKLDEDHIHDDGFGNHSHIDYEILLFINGKADFVIENRKFELKSGDLIFIPPGQHHSVNIDPSVPYERYVVKFPDYEMPVHLIPLIQQKSGCFKSDNIEIIQLFQRFDSHIKTYRGIDLCGLLKCVLFEILYFTCNDSHLVAYEIYKENMIEVINYINENISKKLSLKDICQHFHYSKSFICKEFQECMNTSIMQYVRTKKMLLADSLIKSGMKPLNIFEQFGFNDYSTFYRAYKKLFGKPPSYKN